MAEPVASSPRNVLAADIQITGTIKFKTDLTLDGKIEGEILSDGTVTIGKQASVNGDIHTGSAVVYGIVRGNITVKDRAELKSTCDVLGDLKASRVVIEDGATLIGRSEITTRPKPK